VSTNDGTRRPKPPPGDPADPQGMIFLMEEFFVWMGMKNYSPGPSSTGG
jgi:hypothetical protein